MTFRSLVTHLFEPQSYTRGWTSLTLINVISRIVGFLLFAVIPRVFGIGTATDIFFFFTNLSSRCSNFLCSINRSVLIPYAIHLRESGKAAEGAFIYRKISSSYLALFLVITVGVAAFPDVTMPIFSRFESAVIVNHHSLVVGLAIYVFLEIVGFVLNDWLFSMRYFTLSATLGLIGSLVYLTSVVTTQGSLGISGLVFCMVAFKAIQIGILAAITRKKFFLAKVSIPRRLKTKVLATYGSSAFSLVFDTIPLLLLSAYSPGSITSLAYAQLLASIPHVLLVEQSEQIVGVHFAELGATQNTDSTNQSFRTSLDRLMVFLIPLCAFLWLIGDHAFSLIFGGLGTSRVVEQSGELFAYLIWLSPILAINGFTVKVLLGQQHVLAGVAHQICLSLAGIVMIYLFVTLHGLVGYGQGICLFYALNVGTLGLVCALVMPRFSYLKGVVLGVRNGGLLACSATFFATFAAHTIKADSLVGQLSTTMLSFTAGYSIAFSLLIGASRQKLGRFFAVSSTGGNDNP